MNYELAKKLFDLGFERKSVTKDYLINQFSRPLTDHEYINVIMMTDLSELIEACGKGSLYFDYTDGMDFTAIRSDFKEHSSTPEEAVALLYLSIKKYETN